MTHLHEQCGQPMVEGLFSRNDPVPSLRSQPVWACDPCQAWEPRDGWHGELPAGWDERSGVWRTADLGTS